MEGKKVIIIGNPNDLTYSEIVSKVLNSDAQVVNIYDKDWNKEDLIKRIKEIQTPSNIITINDVQYVLRPKTNNKSSKTVSKYLIMASIFAGVSYIPNIGGRGIQLPSDISLIPEFELIQQKKSKLSRRQRDYVESLFFKEYMTLEEFKEKYK